MYFDRGKRKLFGDLAIFNSSRLVQRFTLDPLSDQAARRDC